MKIKWGALVVDGRGKLGGHVAAKNKSGNYLRTKVTPTNPNTMYQSAVRALFGAISQAWSGLSDSARLGWNAAVDQWQRTDIFGDLKNPSGKALFQRLNNQAQIAGYPAVTTVPDRLDMPILNFGTPVISVGGETVEIATGGGIAGATILVFATPPLSAGTTFVKDQLRLIEHHTSNVEPDAQLFQAYADKFGTPEIGNNIYFALKVVLPNGQASPLQTFKAEVSA